MFKAGYYLPPTMTFSEFLGLIGQIVNHLAKEYVYKTREDADVDVLIVENGRGDSLLSDNSYRLDDYGNQLSI